MKGLLKKIALLTLVLCLVIPFIPKAYAAVDLTKYTPTTFEVMGVTSKSNAITGISNSSTGSTGQIMACHVGDASKGEDSETLYIDSIYYTADDTIAKYNS